MCWVWGGRVFIGCVLCHDGAGWSPNYDCGMLDLEGSSTSETFHLAGGAAASGQLHARTAASPQLPVPRHGRARGAHRHVFKAAGPRVSVKGTGCICAHGHISVRQFFITVSAGTALYRSSGPLQKVCSTDPSPSLNAHCTGHVIRPALIAAEQNKTSSHHLCRYRIGWVSGPAPIVAKVAQVVQGSSAGPCSLSMVCCVNVWMCVHAMGLVLKGDIAGGTYLPTTHTHDPTLARHTIITMLCPLPFRTCVQTCSSHPHTLPSAQVLVSEMLSSWGAVRFEQFVQQQQCMYRARAATADAAAKVHLSDLATWEFPVAGVCTLRCGSMGLYKPTA